MTRVDVDIPALNDSGAFNSDNPVVVAADDLANAKFSTFGVFAVDDRENKFAKGLAEELSLVAGNLSFEDASEPPKVNPEPVRRPPLGIPTKEVCVAGNDAWVLVLLSNLNVTDLAVVIAGLFNGGNNILSPTRLLLVAAGSVLLSSSPFAGLFRFTSGNFVPPKLSVADAFSVSLIPSPLAV